MNKLLRVMVLVLALCLVVIGVLVGGLGIVASQLGAPADSLMGITVSVAVVALCVGTGLSLAWQAARSIQNLESPTFVPRRVWLLGPAFVLALLFGQLVLTLDLLPGLCFPPFYVMAAVLPPLLVIGLVGRRLGGITRWRDIVWQTGSGTLLSTSLALTLESLVVVGLAVVIGVLIALQPGGVDKLWALADLIQAQDVASLTPILQSSAVWFLILVVAAGAVPVIEEAVKTIGVALFSHRRPTMAESLLWGLTGGAGFALAEGLLNTAGALEGWGMVALLRSGATLLHCFTGGLMGLAWFVALQKKSWVRAFPLYAASVFIHAVWNGLTVIMALLGIRSLGEAVPAATALEVSLGTALALSLMLLLILAIGLGLIGVVWYVSTRAVDAVDLNSDSCPGTESLQELG